MSDWKNQVEERAKEERRGFDYTKTAFMMKRPYSSAIVKGPFRLPDRGAHKKAVAKARSLGLYLWYTAIVNLNGKDVAQGHHLVDFESVPDTAEEVNQSQLKCPHCGKICTSTSGLTLHVSHKHRGRQ